MLETDFYDSETPENESTDEIVSDIITTERLELLPLTAHQLEIWANELETLEAELNCTYRAEPMEGMFREIVLGQLKATEQDPINYRWHNFWLMLHKPSRTVIGAADFKDVPNKDGEVEIGYGLNAEFSDHGYMTETVKAMCAWALCQPGVKKVTAETEIDNFPSQNILRRCGFTEKSRGETVWWCLE